MQEFRETKLGRAVGRYILTLTYMYNISNIWGQLRKYKIAEQKGVWRPIKCGSTLFESSTEALFVLPLIAQAPKTVGRANYFSLNWKCNFWPLSRLKRRNQAFPFNGIVFSELWLWSFSLFSFARAHPTQYQLARVTKWNILKSKGFAFILMIFASKIKMIKGALKIKCQES